MLKRLVIFLSIATLAASGASLLIAQPAMDAKAEKAMKQAPDKVRLQDQTGPYVRQLDEARQTPQAGLRNGTRLEKNTPVTVIYDDGVVTAVPALTSNCYGNQFDTAGGNPIKSFSLSRMSFYIMPAAGTDNVFVSVFGGPGGGTTASVLSSASIPLNNGPGLFNTHTFATPITGSGSFLAGIWFVSGDTVGLGSGTVGGQGHHGMLINDIVGTGFMTIPGINALVGASTAFIPVELMDFTVTDE